MRLPFTRHVYDVAKFAGVVEHARLTSLPLTGDDVGETDIVTNTISEKGISTDNNDLCLYVGVGASS